MANFSKGFTRSSLWIVVLFGPVVNNIYINALLMLFTGFGFLEPMCGKSMEDLFIVREQSYRHWQCKNNIPSKNLEVG